MIKKIIYLILLLVFCLKVLANDLLVINTYSKSFNKAYSLYPSIPKGVLEAIAYTQTRFTHLNQNKALSCIELPQAYSVMGLVEDGKGYFRNNLEVVSSLSGYNMFDIKNNPENCILAYAKAFNTLQIQLKVYGETMQDYIPVFIQLSELPINSDLQADYAMNVHLYQLYWFMGNKLFQEYYGFKSLKVDLQKIFGYNLTILSANHVYVSSNKIQSQSGITYKNAQLSSILTSDYGPAIWDAAASCNYSSRAGTQITAIAIHDVEGTYAGCISWFKNCAASASAHYVVRSSDGQITQMVLEANKAWHIGSENPYTVGIEHEGYNNSASWYTNAMYVSSANLTKDICQSYSISPLRTYYGPGCSGTTQQCALGACTKVKGHQMYPNQTHNDPGPYWNWQKYYKLINNTYSNTAVYTATSGAFYDSGGLLANYSNDERKFWLFTKSGATNITLSFNTFNLENGYDNLFIYDGGNQYSPLIGQFTGSINPGAVTTANDSLLVEFRSDCATTASGWVANYIINSNTVTIASDSIVPTTSLTTSGSAYETAAFTATYTDTDNIGGSGVDKGYYQVIDFDGTEWRANYTHGFLADNFDNAIHSEWTQKIGTWTVSANALVQIDETSSVAGNTNIYAALTQTLSNRYLYQFVAKFEGAGNQRRAGFHFFCDSPDSSNRGNSYFVWFRLDDQKVQIYKVVNNVFGLPKVDLPLSFTAGTWYDFKTIYDRVTGKIYVYMNNELVASWTDLSPSSTGGKYISFRSGNCKFSIDELKVYRSRGNQTTISVGNGLTNDIRYQNPSPTANAAKIKSICQDIAGNLSAIYFQNLNIDWTPPSNISTINDGKGADITKVCTKDSLSANWLRSNDNNSAIVRYWVSIGTSAGATNILNWTSNWVDTTITNLSLNLLHNTIYYYNVKAENGAGLFSNVITSNGQKVDTTLTCNSIITDIYNNVITTQNSLIISPNPFNEIIDVCYHLSEDSDIEITILDALGKIITKTRYNEQFGSFKKTLSLSKFNLSPGIYFIKSSINNKTTVTKIIKEH